MRAPPASEHRPVRSLVARLDPRRAPAVVLLLAPPVSVTFSVMAAAPN